MTNRRWTALFLAGMVLLASGCARPASYPPAVDVTRPAEPDRAAPAPTTGEGGQPAGEVSRPTQPKQPAPTPPAKQAPALPPADKVPAAALFPSEDISLTFGIWDEGANPVDVTETLVRDGNRVAAAYNGRVYLTWHLLESGAWRRDPKGGGALLRYLPPVLKEGLAWKQKSGDAEVWFKLNRAAAPCLKYYEKPPEGDCWQLAVLNRGEWSGFRFSAGNPVGPNQASAVVWGEVANSFEKNLSSNWQNPPPTKAVREEILTRTEPSPTGSLPAVTEVSLAEFRAEVMRQLVASQPGRPTTEIDLNLDGQMDLIRGTLGEWTDQPLEFFRSDGTRLGKFTATEAGQQRATLRTLAGDKRPYFVYEIGDPHGRRRISIMGYEESFNKGGAVVMGWGFEPKFFLTYGTSWDLAPDNTFTVVWRLGDAARHARVSTWTITGFRGESRGFGPGIASLKHRQFKPEGAELVYPDDPRGVLEAAFFAFWFDLNEEMGRYFANPEAQAAMRALKGKVPQPTYAPGTVTIGRLGPATRENQYMAPVPSITAGPVAEDGSVEFKANWNGYEFLASAWGKAVFARDGQGRWQIKSLRFDNQQIIGP